MNILPDELDAEMCKKYNEKYSVSDRASVYKNNYTINETISEKCFTYDMIMPKLMQGTGLYSYILRSLFHILKNFLFSGEKQLLQPRYLLNNNIQIVVPEKSIHKPQNRKYLQNVKM